MSNFSNRLTKHIQKHEDVIFIFIVFFHFLILLLSFHLCFLYHLLIFYVYYEIPRTCTMKTYDRMSIYYSVNTSILLLHMRCYQMIYYLVNKLKKTILNCLRVYYFCLWLKTNLQAIKNNWWAISRLLKR